MIQKVYVDLSEICIKELHPRGFILKGLSSSTWLGGPNLDSEGNIWTKDRFMSSEAFDEINGIMTKASGNTDPIDLKVHVEGRVIPKRLVYDWKDLDVGIFKIADDKFELQVPENFYANRALISKMGLRKTYLVGEKPPFPINSCKIVLLRDGILDDSMPAIRYRGALDLNSYKELLASHQGGSLKADSAGIKTVRKMIEFYSRRFEVFLEGFTRREQYSLGLDPLRMIKC